MALFIGGRADGRRMALTNPSPHVRLPYARPLRAYDLDPKANEEIIEMQVENYVQIYGDIYVHEELERVDLIKLLAAGYRQEGYK